MAGAAFDNRRNCFAPPERRPHAALFDEICRQRDNDQRLDARQRTGENDRPPVSLPRRRLAKLTLLPGRADPLHAPPLQSAPIQRGATATWVGVTILRSAPPRNTATPRPLCYGSILPFTGAARR